MGITVDLDRFLYDVSLDSESESCGDVEYGSGYYSLIEGGMSNRAVHHQCKGFGYYLAPEDRKTVQYMAGAIVNTTSQGFHYSETYDTKEALDRKWKELQDEEEQTDREGNTSVEYKEEEGYRYCCTWQDCNWVRGEWRETHKEADTDLATHLKKVHEYPAPVTVESAGTMVDGVARYWWVCSECSAQGKPTEDAAKVEAGRKRHMRDRHGK